MIQRSVAFHADGQLDQAAQELRKLLRKYPRDVQGLLLAGLLECARDDFVRGCGLLAMAARLAPMNPEVLLHHGTALGDADRHEEALDVLEPLKRLEAENPVTHYMTGNALMGQLRTAEAAASYARAVELAPLYKEARWNHAVAELTLGHFDQGWLLAESRRTLDGHSAARDYPPDAFLQPGQRLEGLRLLLYPEQGLGDTLQFARYASRFADLGALVQMEVQAPLRTLLAQMDDRVTVFATGETEHACDVVLPLMSAPWVLGETEAPAALPPYVRADQDRVSHWAARLGASDKPRVGVVWQGSKMNANDRRRSIAAATFESLFGPSFFWCTLAREIDETERAWLGKHGVAAHDEALSDFGETAALIENLDLVITVDTSVAHLAGAMGKPTWILLPYSPDWRWMLGRDDSPWYSSVRLFRQTERGDWTGVIERVRTALAERFG